MITRAIPATGESLPAVGLGTAAVFDAADAATLQKASAVVRALIDNGGKLIDTASTYGDAERVLGDAIAPAGLRNELFIATKLESPDVEELKRSLNRLRTAKLDLLQLHNVSNPQQSLGAFQDWKAQGVCRYVGITSTFHGAFDENAALRYQVVMLRRIVHRRVRLTNSDRIFFIQLYRWFPSVLKVIAVIRPETLVRWHRAGFRRYWRWKSRSFGGRPRVDAELRALIRRMSVENPLWGAPRIHGELLKLGFEVAQSSVAKYMVERHGPPSQGWRTFLRNHAPDIAAMSRPLASTCSMPSSLFG